MAYKTPVPQYAGDPASVANGDIWYNTSTGKLRKREGGVTSNLDTTASSEAFAVGSIFLSVVSTNPATLLGYGTWSAIGAGRVLVGLDSGDTDFDTVEETGGAKTVAGAGSVGSHTHSVTSNVAVGNHSTRSVEDVGLNPVTVLTTSAVHSVTNNAVTSGGTAPTFTGTATSVVQPYFVCYMWKRTA